MTRLLKRRNLRMNWRDCEFLVVDLETTGLDLARDRVVSYGAVPVAEGRVITAQAAYSLVNPGRPVNPSSIRVHTLRDVDLKDAPPVDAAMQHLSSLLEGRILVAHAAWVETAFLKRGFAQICHSKMPPAIDTAALARAVGLAPRNAASEPNLEWLCTKLGLPVIDPHNALGDALTAAGLFVALAGTLESRGERTAASLLDTSDCESTHTGSLPVLFRRK